MLYPPNKITNNPATTKNTRAFLPLKTEAKPPTPNNPGAVPRANKPIIIAPVPKLPELTANNCIA